MPGMQDWTRRCPERWLSPWPEDRAWGGECGAVAAAYIVLGMKYGFTHPGDPERLDAVMGKIRTFVDRFKALHGDIDCPKLIGLDLFSEEGRKAFAENNLKATVCTQYVADAVKILEELLQNP